METSASPPIGRGRKNWQQNRESHIGGRTSNAGVGLSKGATDASEAQKEERLGFGVERTQQLARGRRQIANKDNDNGQDGRVSG